MDKILDTFSAAPTPWLRKIERYVALGQKTRALLLLEKGIGSDMPLFWDDPAIQGDRRFAWLCRIELLREWGRYSEALAWTCLECELNPVIRDVHEIISFFTDFYEMGDALSERA
jgi:hypothetical protein